MKTVLSRGLLVFAVLLGGLVAMPSVAQDDARPSVVATIFPVFEFARIIAGDLIDLSLVIAEGVEAHDFDPTLADIEKFSVADLFIYNGSGFETPWVNPLIEGGLLGANGQLIVETTSLLNERGQLLPAPPPDDEDFINDPHVWLDPILSIGLVDAIEAGLIALLPDNVESISANATQLRADLINLDSAYSDGLANCSSRDVIASHQFLNYFGERYGFNALSPSGLEPEEPTIQVIEDLIVFVNENNVTALFSEEDFDAEESGLLTISEATGAQIFNVNPLEALEDEDLEAGVTYFDAMQSNLSTFMEALDC